MKFKHKPADEVPRFCAPRKFSFVFMDTLGVIEYRGPGSFPCVHLRFGISRPTQIRSKQLIGGLVLLYQSKPNAERSEAWDIATADLKSHITPTP